MSCIRRFVLAIMGFAMPVIAFALVYTEQNGSARAVASQPLYDTLFPKPTGKNGYEEFVKAEDVFTASPAFLESERLFGERGPAEIDAKRKLLADPKTQQVLSVLRTGLKKRTHSPRVSPELYTLIPELRDFRAIARLMCSQIDILFADGKAPEAIDCLNDGLDFGRDVQVGTLMSGVVGLYIENTVLQSFADHIGMLDDADCDKLAHVTRRQLKRADPQIALVAAERDMFLRTLRGNRNDACALLNKLDPGPNISKSIRRDYTDVCRLAKEDTSAGGAVLDRTADLVTAHFSAVTREIRRPVWERIFSQPVNGVLPESKLLFSLFPSDYSRLSDRFASETLKVQMLALEAAIVRYLRHNGSLPESLAELNPGKLLIDPFSGKQLGYERKGIDAFTISSVGPYNAGDSKHAPSGSRTPVIVAFPPRS